MSASEPVNESKTMYLADYLPSEFITENVCLGINIHDDHTIVTSKVIYKRTAKAKGATTLVLNAENPNLDNRFIDSVTVNGLPLVKGTDYTIDEENNELLIPFDAAEYNIEVEIDTYLEPQNNSQLEGYYKSDSCVVTQCEPESFRRITPFLDRPDVMAKYRVYIEANKKDYPVLMANGNETASGDVGDKRHFAVFKDPFPKPSYLFATVNGDLQAVEDVFTTMSGRKVNVRVFIEAGAGDVEKGRHALECLKSAMKWDEHHFGCEYDLDNYNVVAVAKFNARAMENKGLNVFRDSLIMASPEIATDANYKRIDDVIAHEYFHNWSGNRVTLANWPNLSLKEGLTVFREQKYTAFRTSEAVERIDTVQGNLRARQYIEDDGPLAHPVLLEKYKSVKNFYTGTVYKKGSEVIRMMNVMMGDDTFSEGVKDYFKTYDGRAVTVKEFVDSMEKVSGLNFSDQFFLWYTQSGRPRVSAESEYDPINKTYALTLEQTISPTADQAEKKPMLIPVKTNLVDNEGKDIIKDVVLNLTKPKQTFIFENIEEEPAYHSIFRNMSAPVSVDSGLGKTLLYMQVLTDTDGFNRWDAGQKLAMMEMTRLYDDYLATGEMPEVNTDYLDMIKTLVNDEVTDPALTAVALTLPSIKEFEGALDGVNPAAIAAVRKHLKTTIGNELEADLIHMFNRNHDDKYGLYSEDYASVGKRSLKAAAIDYLLADKNSSYVEKMKLLYDKASHMTDQMIAMSAINDHMGEDRDAVFADFYDRFKDDQLTIQKWFAMQAYADSDDIVDHINQITESDVFNWENPGHIGGLLGAFGANYEQFHRADGNGYGFVADTVLAVDKFNSQTAARLIVPLCEWEKYSDDHQKLMIGQLERIAAELTLSVDVKDKALKALSKKDDVVPVQTPDIPSPG